MRDVLANIVEFRKKSLRVAKDNVSFSTLEQEASKVVGKSFAAALQKDDHVSVISEMKRKSPSAGLIRDPYDPVSIALGYERGGAAALSVLTEPDFFGGDIADMKTVAETVALPVLRKDFIFDPYQIVEARANGADAVLLIADMLDGTLLRELVGYALEMRLDPLVEVFTAAVLPQALNSGASLIGINTRNLRTLEMVPDNVMALSRLIPRDRTIVAESGLKTPEEIKKLRALRVSAVLVGESLLKQDNTEQAVRTLVEAGQRHES